MIDISPDHPQRTFVFIHGFGGQAEQWQYQLQKFFVENRVIALDLRGHGLSDKPSRGYEMPQLVSDLETALTLLKVKGKFVLAGHSYGGAIVTEYALKNTDRVERLILLATAGEFHLKPVLRLALSLPVWLLKAIEPFTRKWLFAPPHVLKGLYSPSQLPFLVRKTYSRPRLSELLLGKVSEKWFRFFVDVSSAAIGHGIGALPERIREQTLLDYKRAAPGVYHIPSAISDMTEYLHEVNTPTLVVWGDQDKTLAPSSFTRLVHTLPRARGEMLHAGHVPHQSHAEHFNQLVLKFLEELP